MDVDGDTVLSCEDCDDADPDNYQGNAEACDGQDNDCNTLADADMDGEVDVDLDGSLSCEDCDDNEPARFPGNPEICDGLDNNCDGEADYGGDNEDDADSDGSLSCADCDDSDPNNFPGNLEACDGQDNDCNDTADAAAAGVAAVDYTVTHSNDSDDLDYAPLPVSLFWPASDEATTQWSVASTYPSFEFDYYGQPMDVQSMSSNGFLSIDSSTDVIGPTAGPLPDPAAPNGTVAIWWEDLDYPNPSDHGVFKGMSGSGDSQVLIIDWWAEHADHPAMVAPVDAQVQFHEETGDIEFHFTMASTDPDGDPETVGIEDRWGILGTVWYQLTTNALETNSALRFSPVTLTEYDYDSDGAMACEDCDDRNQHMYPSNTEVCDGLDNDCDGQVDEDNVCPCPVTVLDLAWNHVAAYMVCDTPSSWQDARSACQSVGMDLATPAYDNEYEPSQVYLAANTLYPTSTSFWMGATDIDAEGTWKWLDGELLSDQGGGDVWFPGQPDDDGDQDCGVLSLDGTPRYFYDAGCGDLLPYVCDIDRHPVY